MITFGAGYLGAVVAARFTNRGGPLYIPVAGPFVWMSSPREIFDADFKDARPFVHGGMTLLGAAQAVGLGLAGDALLAPPRPGAAAPGALLISALGPGSAILVVAGRI